MPTERAVPSLADEEDSDREDLPIECYGLIGDCHGAALVAHDGSIDWCCFKRLDDDPLFARLLDRRRGGCFEIRPVEAAQVERRYAEASNVLETTFSTAQGSVRLVDFMWLERPPESGEAEFMSPRPPGWIVRMATGLSGRVRLRVRYQPVGGGFELRPLALRLDGGAIAADGCPKLHAETPLELREGAALGWFELSEGASRSFILAPADCSLEGRSVGETAEALLAETSRFWRDWCEFAGYEGPYGPEVVRSALALKLLSYAPSGAIVAAPTTSLPEGVGTPRTWDYRYCWPRDAALTFFSLAKFGHAGEGLKLLDFLIDDCSETLPRVLPLYGITGETDPEERCYEDVEGWRGSRPVRVGNSAAEQHQLDVYGHVMDALYLCCRLGGALSPRARRLARILADFVAEHWREPDAGIWEPRRPPQRYVHSAMLAWAALDRAVRMLGPNDAWTTQRDAILAEILKRGVHPAKGCLTQVFGGEEVDAALLIAPMLGLPLDRGIVERTIEQVRADLAVGPLVYRYKTEDGIEGEEGAFLLCSFWLVDALLAVGRGEEAEALFEELLRRSNDLGLYSEQCGEDGVFLGNFPQGFTHLGVIHSAMALQLYRREGVAGVSGSYADRADRIVERDERHRLAWSSVGDGRD